MSKPKIKEIKNMSEASDADCIFYLQYNPEMTQIMVTMTTKQAVTPEEFIDALAGFVNEVSEHPHNLFVETIDNSADPNLH